MWLLMAKNTAWVSGSVIEHNIYDAEETVLTDGLKSNLKLSFLCFFEDIERL